MRRLRLVLFVGILIGSLAANALLYRFADRYFRESQEVRLDPAGLLVYAAEPPTRVSDRPRVVLFGDSRAQMWDFDSLPAGAEILNRGIGSQTTQQVLARVDSHLLDLDADVVIVQAGVNDLKTIGTFPERRDWIMGECRRNLARIVERAASTGADVIVTTVFPCGTIDLPRRPYWSAQIDSAIIDVNAFIAGMRRERVHVVDAWSILEQDGAVAPEYELDALHLSEAGYIALNRSIAPLIRSIVASREARRSKADERGL